MAQCTKLYAFQCNFKKLVICSHIIFVDKECQNESIKDLIYIVQELPVWSQEVHFNTYIQLNQIFKDSFHVFLSKKHESWITDFKKIYFIKTITEQQMAGLNKSHNICVQRLQRSLSVLKLL